MLNLNSILHHMSSESKTTYLIFGKNSVNTKSSFLESDTTLISSIVTLLKKVSTNVSMPDNMSMILNLISSSSHLYSEHSELVVLSSKITKMSQSFVNLSLPKLLEPLVMLLVKQEQRCKNFQIIILMQFWMREIFGILKMIQKKINKDTFKLSENFKVNHINKNLDKY